MAAKEVEILQPAFYQRFACIGPACDDNCCHSWPIQVDKAHYLYYRGVREPAFRELCAASLRRKKKDATPEQYAYIAHPADGRCPFQDGDGGCRMIRLLGPDSLCDTCAIYPRRKAQYLPGLWELSLSLSCQEAARLALFSGGPVVFQQLRREPCPNDPLDRLPPLTTGGRAFVPPPAYGQPLRQACLALMGRGAYPLPERILAIALLLRRAQRLLAEGRPAAIPAMAGQFLEAVDRGEFAGFFRRLDYHRLLHLKALHLPVLHLLSGARAPVFRQLLDTLLARCVQDPATGEYRAEEAALELLLEEAAEKGDPVLARHPQAVENYFVCYLFSGLFPMLYHSRGLTLEENGVLLAEQYALLRMLLAILPVEEGEPEEQRLVRSVVALARITQHSDLGGALRVLRGGAGMDEMTQVAYLLR